MKKALKVLCCVLVLMIGVCTCASAISMELYNLANELCKIDIEGYESSARYYEREALFTFSMQNTVVIPAVWEYLDDKTIREHYRSYISMAVQLEDAVWKIDKDITVVTTFQLADGTAVYLTINGLDCSQMVYN